MTAAEMTKPRSVAWYRSRRRLWHLFLFLGFDPRRLLKSIGGIPVFIRDLARYKRMSPRPSFCIRWLDLYPVLDERQESAGAIGGHYFHQDLWAARKIHRQGPERHIDIGSRIDGFVAHVLTFIPVTLIDIRPVQSTVPGLEFVQDDATQLQSFDDGSIVSLSSLHAAEHFGLGRYSDPIEPDACFRFMKSLQRTLRPGGRLYFSVPIGRERVDFNAHRVFAPETILTTFSGLSLLSFSYVDDAGQLHEDRNPTAIPQIEYGCGLFEFTKDASIPGNLIEPGSISVPSSEE